MSKILIVGKNNDETSLEAFYKCAFRGEGYVVDRYVFFPTNNLKIIFDRLRLLVSSWLNNKESIELKVLNANFVSYVLRSEPQIIVVFTNTPVFAETLIYIKSTLKNIKIVYYWADTVLNLERALFDAAPFYDLCAIHSKTLVSYFYQFGFKRCKWIPFGFDSIHNITMSKKLYDIGFAGGHSIEREEVINAIVQNFPSLRVAIAGQGWQNVKSRQIKKSVVAGVLYGSAYSDFHAACRVSINIISKYSKPSTNMRFFELMVSDSIQITTYTSEQAEVYREGQELFYFETNQELVEKINKVFSLSEIEYNQIINNARIKAVKNASYQTRARDIIFSLNL